MARRITIDLNDESASEVERLRELTDLTTAELFRHAFNLIRIYVRSRQQGSDLCIIDPNGRDRVIELPFLVRSTQSTEQGKERRVAARTRRI